MIPSYFATFSLDRQILWKNILIKASTKISKNSVNNFFTKAVKNFHETKISNKTLKKQHYLEALRNFLLNSQVFQLFLKLKITTKFGKKDVTKLPRIKSVTKAQQEWKIKVELTNQRLWDVRRELRANCKDATSDVAIAKVILKSFGLDGIAIMRDVIQWIQEIDFTRKKLASTKQKQTLSEFMRQSLAPRDETTTNRLQSSEHPQEWYLIITKKTILYSWL